MNSTMRVKIPTLASIKELVAVTFASFFLMLITWAGEAGVIRIIADCTVSEKSGIDYYSGLAIAFIATVFVNTKLNIMWHHVESMYQVFCANFEWWYPHRTKFVRAYHESEL